MDVRPPSKGDRAIGPAGETPPGGSPAPPNDPPIPEAAVSTPSDDNKSVKKAPTSAIAPQNPSLHSAVSATPAMNNTLATGINGTHEDVYVESDATRAFIIDEAQRFHRAFHPGFHRSRPLKLPRYDESDLFRYYALVAFNQAYGTHDVTEFPAPLLSSGSSGDGSPVHCPSFDFMPRSPIVQNPNADSFSEFQLSYDAWMEQHKESVRRNAEATASRKRQRQRERQAAKHRRTNADRLPTPEASADGFPIASAAAGILESNLSVVEGGSSGELATGIEETGKNVEEKSGTDVEETPGNGAASPSKSATNTSMDEATPSAPNMTDEQEEAELYDSGTTEDSSSNHCIPNLAEHFLRANEEHCIPNLTQYLKRRQSGDEEATEPKAAKTEPSDSNDDGKEVDGHEDESQDVVQHEPEANSVSLNASARQESSSPSSQAEANNRHDWSVDDFDENAALDPFRRSLSPIDVSSNGRLTGFDVPEGFYCELEDFTVNGKPVPKTPPNSPASSNTSSSSSTSPETAVRHLQINIKEEAVSVKKRPVYRVFLKYFHSPLSVVSENDEPTEEVHNGSFEVEEEEEVVDDMENDEVVSEAGDESDEYETAEEDSDAESDNEMDAIDFDDTTDIQADGSANKDDDVEIFEETDEERDQSEKKVDDEDDRGESQAASSIVSDDEDVEMHSDDEIRDNSDGNGKGGNSSTIDNQIDRPQQSQLIADEPEAQPSIETAIDPSEQSQPIERKNKPQARRVKSKKPLELIWFRHIQERIKELEGQNGNTEAGNAAVEPSASSATSSSSKSPPEAPSREPSTTAIDQEMAQSSDEKQASGENATTATTLNEPMDESLPHESSPVAVGERIDSTQPSETEKDPQQQTGDQIEIFGQVRLGQVQKLQGDREEVQKAKTVDKDAEKQASEDTSTPAAVPEEPMDQSQPRDSSPTAVDTDMPESSKDTFVDDRSDELNDARLLSSEIVSPESPVEAKSPEKAEEPPVSPSGTVDQPISDKTADGSTSRAKSDNEDVEMQSDCETHDNGNGSDNGDNAFTNKTGSSPQQQPQLIDGKNEPQSQMEAAIDSQPERQPIETEKETPAADLPTEQSVSPSATADQPISNNTADGSVARATSPDIQNTVGPNGYIPQSLYHPRPLYIGAVSDRSETSNDSDSFLHFLRDESMPSAVPSSSRFELSDSDSDSDNSSHFDAMIEDIVATIRGMEPTPDNQVRVRKMADLLEKTRCSTNHMDYVLHNCPICNQRCHQRRFITSEPSESEDEDHAEIASTPPPEVPQKPAEDTSEGRKEAEDDETASKTGDSAAEGNDAPMEVTEPEDVITSNDVPAPVSPKSPPQPAEDTTEHPDDISMTSENGIDDQVVTDGGNAAPDNRDQLHFHDVKPMTDADFEAVQPVNLADYVDDIVLDQPRYAPMLTPPPQAREPSPMPSLVDSRSSSPIIIISDEEPMEVDVPPAKEPCKCGPHCRCPRLFGPPKNRRPSREAPFRRSNPRQNRRPIKKRDRKPRRRQTDPEFGRLQHVGSLQHATLPDAPPVVDSEQMAVIDGIHLDPEHQVSLVRGNHFEAALYTSGVVVLRGFFEGGSIASAMLRQARSQPVPIFHQPDDPAVKIAGGPNHLIILTDSGRVYTIGRAVEGQLGVGDPSRYRQGSVAPGKMLRRIYEVVNGRKKEVKIDTIKAGGNVTIATTENGKEFGCGESYGHTFKRIN